MSPGTSLFSAKNNIPVQPSSKRNRLAIIFDIILLIQSYTVTYLSTLDIDFILQRQKLDMNKDSAGVMVDQLGQGSAPSNSVFPVNKIPPKIHATRATNGL
jgi:hypothetical protein